MATIVTIDRHMGLPFARVRPAALYLEHALTTGNLPNEMDHGIGDLLAETLSSYLVGQGKDILARLTDGIQESRPIASRDDRFEKPHRLAEASLKRQLVSVLAQLLPPHARLWAGRAAQPRARP